MSLELTAQEQADIKAVLSVWETTPDMELEAVFRSANHTTFLDVVKYFRSIGLKEVVHAPKLNIMVDGGLRFTIVGDGLIQKYCHDDSLKGKPYQVMQKERRPTGAAGAPSEVELPDYDVRVKIRRELMLARDDSRVLSALANWHAINKSFRYIKRYSYTSDKNPNVRYDISLVRENKKDARGHYISSKSFGGADINRQPIHYEIEVEIVRSTGEKKASVNTLCNGIMNVLRGIQRTYAPVRKSTADAVLDQLEMSIWKSPKTNAKMKIRKFPGTQPHTFHDINMDVEQVADVPNIRFERYNVTDKADGLRTLLVVTKAGRVYLIDRSMNVYGTNLRVKDAYTRSWGGAVLDGELVTRNAKGEPMYHYYAFDIYNGEDAADVSGRPFYDSSENPVSRLAALTQATAVLGDETYMTRTVNAPKNYDLKIFMKSFMVVDDRSAPNDIFGKAAAMMDRLKSNPPYHTDGLIFTPNADPLPKTGKAWARQLKWKPSTENSVDFLVTVERERDLAGGPTGSELIKTMVKEDTRQIVQYKTLRLYVGSTKNPAFNDPRATILNKEALPVGDETVSYRPAEFSPQPPDPMASVCYIALNAGATDAAGAAPAAGALEARKAVEGKIFCESGDQITSGCIVEMVYNTDEGVPDGWRWIPKRVRWDKTEQYARGRIGGTLNSEDTANDVWTSIHNPVTEDMIRTGSMIRTKAIGSKQSYALSYYQRRAPTRDLLKVGALTEFHNKYIKQSILLGPKLVKRGMSLIDFSMGQAGDLHKWIDRGVSWVLGGDIAESGLTDNRNGAYRRLMNRVMQNPRVVPPMIFVQADSSKRYKDGSAGMKELDRTLLQTLWGAEIPNAPAFAKDLRGRAAEGFDVASLMFSLHYFFKDRQSLDGLLRNLSDTVKIGGFFVGCCFDGQKVVDLLKDVENGGIKRGQDKGDPALWTIKKRYEDNALPANDECLGKMIDVNFISISDEMYTEYLVSWAYFVERAKEIGLEMCNPEELAELGMQYSTNTFDVSYSMALKDRRINEMESDALKTFSFLNRWFIFRRRSAGEGLVELAPGVAAAQTAREADEMEGPQGPLGVAPQEEARASVTIPANPVSVPVGAVVEVPGGAAAGTTPTNEEEIEAEALGDFEAAVEKQQEVVTAAAVPPPAEEPPVSYTNSPNTPSPDAAAPAAAVESENGLKVAAGPIYKFYHKSSPADDLKLKNKQWRRFISTFAPFGFKDPKNPAIIYPNLEAALGAAKFQLASDLPDLGAQVFGIAGKIHQEFEAKRAALNHAPTEEELASLIEQEGKAMQEAQRIKYKKLGDTKAKFNEAAWTDGRETVLVEYVRLRYETDSEFRKSLDAVKGRDGRLVCSSLGSGNELSGKVEGETITGDNLYGRALMRVIGLKY